MSEYEKLELNVRIFSHIPMVLREMIEDMQYPLISKIIGSPDPKEMEILLLKRKMLYQIYKVSLHHLTFGNKDLFMPLIMAVNMDPDATWDNFQTALNGLIMRGYRV